MLFHYFEMRLGGGAKESEEITGGVGIWILLLLLEDIIGPSAMELFIESSSHFSLHQGLKEGSVKNEIILHPPNFDAWCLPPHIHDSGNARNKMYFFF